MQNAQLSDLRLPSLRSLRFHTADDPAQPPPTPTSASSTHPQQPWPRAPDAPPTSAPRPQLPADRYGPPPAYSFEPAPQLAPALSAAAAAAATDGQQPCWPSQQSQTRVAVAEPGTYNGTMHEQARARTMQTPFRFDHPQSSSFDIQPAPPAAPRDQHEFAAPAPFYASPDAHSRPATMQQQQQQQYPALPMPPAWTPTSLSPPTISPLDAMSEKPKPATDNRNKSISPPDIIAKIVAHCSVLCQFAAKYEPVPQAPPDDEVDEMAELALSVVRLIEDLHRVTIGMDEPLPPFSPTILADLGLPREPSIAQSDADREAATPLSSEAAAERGRKRSWDEMASSERESQADRDMAIIRAKRMAQVAQAANSASGSTAPQSKAKYKKRSPGLKRTMPPEKCQACYNSETPEWRRGPYGARTLCNACGIHYSKMKSKRDGGESDPDEDMAELRRTVSRNPAESGGRARRTKRAHSTSTSKQFAGGGEFQVTQSSAMASHEHSPPGPMHISPELQAPRPTQQAAFVNDPGLQNRPVPAMSDPTMQAQHRSLPAFVDYSRQQTAHLPQLGADDRYFQGGGMAQSVPQQNTFAAPSYPPPGGGNPLMLDTYSIRSAPSGPQPYVHPPSNVRSSPHLAS